LSEAPLDNQNRQALSSVIGQIDRSWGQTVLYFQGPRDAGKRRLAEALANESGALLLCADLSRAANISPADFAGRLKLLFREALLRNAFIYLDEIDSLRGDEYAPHFQNLLAALDEAATPVILSGCRAWAAFNHHVASKPLGVIAFTVPFPGFTQRERYWREHLAAAGLELDDRDLGALASRFRLRSDQIAEAATSARNWIRLVVESPSPDEPSSVARERLVG